MEWNDIKTTKELNNFLKLYDNFHDCCLKELRYVSGAYVNEKLEMNPINTQRKLYIIFQRQCQNVPVVELEFSGLIKLSLNPNNEMYTCEVIDSSMFLEDGKIYWADSDSFVKERDLYAGTWLCAEKIRWRIVEEYMGDTVIY